MITKSKIRSGIREHLVRFIFDPNMESGTVCQIGDNWFYFGGETAEELDPEAYLAAVPEDDIVNEIFGTLEDFRRDEALRDEYDYYDAVLTFRNGV
ncbi:hypothetical protein [Agathobaculum desmolans]|mgnify:CR=1 FL=1|uniref:hypothetical protein n=1 Tax=Agathobaculum desmolans TaxID=39484 RepID=UPI00248E2AF9|nr:hypothetical protein [Agathobaculum desmolans]